MAQQWIGSEGICSIPKYVDSPTGAEPALAGPEQLGIANGTSAFLGYVVKEGVPQDIEEEFEAGLLRAMRHTVYREYLKSKGYSSGSVADSSAFARQISDLITLLENGFQTEPENR